MLRLLECFAAERVLIDALLRNHERIMRVYGGLDSEKHDLVLALYQVERDEGLVDMNYHQWLRERHPQLATNSVARTV